MSSPKDAAKAFTIAGLLDESAATRRRFPIEEIEVSDIEDHPGNAVYSMDEEAIGRLAESIRRDGLTDIPLVRKLPDGGFQMISGHRRKAAYRLLAEDDESFARMPCRIVESVTDEQAIALLHAANYFTRELSVTERAAATRALGEEVERMRRSDPGLSGMRTEDIKAEIISAQTGRKVSGKSIRRQEALASIIENDLSTGWRSLADEGRLSSEAARMLSKVPRKEQMRLHVRWTEEGGYGKRDTTDFIRRNTSKGADADDRLRRADREIQKFLSRHRTPLPQADRGMIEAIARHAEELGRLL